MKTVLLKTYTKHHKACAAGFSLIEMSVVLVVIAALIGGIFVGKSLIQNSKMQSTVKQIQAFQSAWDNFTTKYYAHPGDFAQATQHFCTPASASACVITTTSEVDNGDGNGFISPSNSGGLETYALWKHLEMAKMLDGYYYGDYGYGSDTTALHYQIGKDNPKADYDASGWLVYEYNSASVNSGKYSNYLTLAGVDSSRLWEYGTLTPSQTENIDLKMDDGRPVTGKVSGLTGKQFSYVGTNCISSGRYNVAYTEPSCFLFYDLGN